METVKGYTAKHTHQPRCTPTVSHRNAIQKEYIKLPPSLPSSTSTSTSNKLSTQQNNVPPNFTSLDSWHRYVKKIIGTYGFLDNTDLESGPKFVGTMKNGCYFCRMINHSHDACRLLMEYILLALAAKENTIDSIPTARTNLTKLNDPTEELPYTDNINNKNVNNYVDNHIYLCNTKSNIVLLCKPTNSSLTSLRSNIKYIDDINLNIKDDITKSNIFTAS